MQSKNAIAIVHAMAGMCYTIFHRINAAATILFTEHNLRLPNPGGGGAQAGERGDPSAPPPPLYATQTTIRGRPLNEGGVYSCHLSRW